MRERLFKPLQSRFFGGSYQRQRRPVGVVLLALCFWLAALFMSAIAMMLLLGVLRAPFVQDANALFVLLASAVMLAIGGLQAWVGYGLWKLKKETYHLVLALMALGIIGGLYEITQGKPLNYSAILVIGAVILYLRIPGVRAAFTE